MILLSATIGYFIYTRTSFNLYEREQNEKILYNQTLENNLNMIIQNGYSDKLMPMESLFYVYRSKLAIENKGNRRGSRLSVEG